MYTTEVFKQRIEHNEATLKAVLNLQEVLVKSRANLEIQKPIPCFMALADMENQCEGNINYLESLIRSHERRMAFGEKE